MRAHLLMPILFGYCICSASAMADGNWSHFAFLAGRSTVQLEDESIPPTIGFQAGFEVSVLDADEV